MPTISTPDGGQIFYVDEGEGPSVLMIHGWSCDGSDWAWLQADFAADHRTVVIDNRGHGHSSVAAEYSPHSFAADAAHVIRELDLGRTIVVGHSMGTIIASTLAVEYPELVSALILVDPVYGADDAALSPVLTAIRQAPHAVASTSFKSFYGRATPEWLPVWHRRRLLATDADTVHKALASLYEGEDGVGRRSVGEEFLPRRQAPILAIYAESGAATAAWEQSLPHRAEDVIEVWEGHGHFLHQEDPARLAERARRWLATLDPVTSADKDADVLH